MFTITTWIGNQTRIIQLAKQFCKINLYRYILKMTVCDSLCDLQCVLLLQRERMQAIRYKMITEDYVMFWWIYQCICIYIYIYMWECKIDHLEWWTSGKITHQVEQIAHTKRCHRVSVTQDIIIYSKKSLKDLSTTNQPKRTFWNRKLVYRQ